MQDTAQQPLSKPAPLRWIQLERGAYLLAFIGFLLYRMAAALLLMSNHAVEHGLMVAVALGCVAAVFAVPAAFVFRGNLACTVIVTVILGGFGLILLVLGGWLLAVEFTERPGSAMDSLSVGWLAFFMVLGAVYLAGAVRLPLLWRKARRMCESV